MRWYYALDGAPAYYQSGRFLYPSDTDRPIYYLSGPDCCSMDGTSAYRVRDDCLYTLDGAPAYFGRDS